jgi:hypothetical protein
LLEIGMFPQKSGIGQHFCRAFINSQKHEGWRALKTVWLVSGDSVRILLFAMKDKTKLKVTFCSRER